MLSDVPWCFLVLSRALWCSFVLGLRKVQLCLLNFIQKGHVWTRASQFHFFWKNMWPWKSTPLLIKLYTEGTICGLGPTSSMFRKISGLGRVPLYREGTILGLGPANSIFRTICGLARLTRCLLNSIQKGPFLPSGQPVPFFGIVCGLGRAPLRLLNSMQTGPFLERKAPYKGKEGKKHL